MFNKVLAQETDKLREFGTRFLEKQGTRLLGIIPYNRALSTCTVRAVAERIGGRVLAGEQYLGNHIGRFLVGALSAGSARKYFENNCLLITGGDRTDMLLAALVYALTGGQSGFKFAGIVLTGGVVPPEDILELLKRAEIPVVAVEQDSFTVTSAIGQMEPKISPADGQKIQTVCDVVRRHVDVKAIFELL
jgi:BioD-like phosphotransacetylase family protein